MRGLGDRRVGDGANATTSQFGKPNTHVKQRNPSVSYHLVFQLDNLADLLFGAGLFLVALILNRLLNVWDH